MDHNKQMLDKIASLRKSKGVTQETIAIALGMNQSNYARFEKGKTTLTVPALYAIADYFRVSPVDILTADPEGITTIPTITSNSTEGTQPVVSPEKMEHFALEILKSLVSAPCLELSEMPTHVKAAAEGARLLADELYKH